MNYALSIALDRPASGRDIGAYVGDEFTVAITFYDTDGATSVADLSGDTATLDVIREGVIEFTVTGSVASGVATFAIDSDLTDIVGRNTWRVKLVRDGSSKTVIDGSFEVRD